MGPRRIQCLTAGLALAALLGLTACQKQGGGGSNESSITVSGTMSIAASSAADSDTNDRAAPFQLNNLESDAQELPNPVTLGGHLNRAGAFPPTEDPNRPTEPGQTTGSGDPEDWFRISIAQNQTLRLAIAEDGSTNDLDLEVIRASDGSLVVPRMTGPARSESLKFDETGNYLVRVIAESGFSNYTLSVGQPSTEAAAAPEADFVPGQLIVQYQETAGAPEARAADVGMRVRGGGDGRFQLLDFSAPSDHAAALRELDLIETAPPQRAFASAAAPSPAAAERSLREDTLRMRDAMRDRPEVRSVDLNYLRQKSATPADEFFDLQWHYQQVNLPEAWGLIGSDPSGVIVAVVDTGVVQGHPDLDGQLVPGWDFIRNPLTSLDGDGCDPNPEDPGDRNTGSRSSFHGTHVTGTVAAATSLQNGGDAVGVAGVAWNARVMPLRVLGLGGGTDFDIMSALEHAAGRAVSNCSPGAGSPARIVNLSLGGPGFSQAFQNLILDLRTHEGMIFVAAAGNDGSTQLSYPAAYDGVISVSATGPTKALAPYSNRGSTIDVAAPGGDFSRDEDGDGFPDGVLSTLYDESEDEFVYAFYQGTSMATPHVAGVIALMLGVDPTITPALLDSLLAQRPRRLTEDIGPATSFGHGLIDAAMAVDAALGGATLSPALRADPDSLNFGLLAEQFTLTVSNVGDDSSFPVTPSIEIEPGEDWLSFEADEVDANGLGTYQIRVDRSGLGDDLYTASLHFASDPNDVEVSVIMQVGDIDRVAEDFAGHHFVLLLDADFGTVDVVEARLVGDEYRFRFDDVAPGEYLIVAGTDSDYDFVICDPGEACGAFPTTDSPQLLVVDGSRHIHFVTGYSASLGAASDGSPRPGYSRWVGNRSR